MPIDDELRAAVAKASGLQANDVDDQDTLDDHLGISSLDLIEIYGYFEEKYDIVITDQEAEPITTLGQMRSLIESKVDAKVIHR
ncbi:phosphopantetheine-binding protein [Nocardia sp. NBC_01499]|uniref:phosphopantetheine-binding protein n=1 Tax=Nocardia sp. NBC_01499 TaxID=2903597 RepID=UPI003869BEC2